MKQFVVGLLLFMFVATLVLPGLTEVTERDVKQVEAQVPVVQRVPDRTEGMVCAMPFGLVLGMLCAIVAKALVGGGDRD